MQEFLFEHSFPLPPADFIGLVDEVAFRDYLIERLGDIHNSDRLVFEDLPFERRKVIRVHPTMHLPGWIERALKRREPHFDMSYRLDKRTLVEEISGESRIGKVSGQISYEAAAGGGTLRKFKGSFHCEVPLLARAIEKFYLARMTSMYDREAELACRYIEENQP